MAAALPPPAIVAEAPLLIADPVVLPATASDRALSLRVTAPTGGRHLPVIVFTHGNRLSREDYRPLIEHWARAGYVIVQMDHTDAAPPGAPPAPNPPGVWRTRIEDIHRTIDGLPTILGAIPGLVTRTDTANLAIAGHSFGGLTAAMIAGAKPNYPTEGLATADPRVRAAILLAPTGVAKDLRPEWQKRSFYADVDFATMRAPVLLVAGGADASEMMTARGPSWRQDAYALAAPGSICRVVIAGADHYLGGINGPDMPPPGDARPDRLALVEEATTRFLDASLKRAAPSFRASVPALARQPAAAAVSCR